MARTAKDEQSKQIRTPTQAEGGKPDTLARGRRGATRSETRAKEVGMGGPEQGRQSEAKTPARKPPMRTGDVGTPIRTLGVPLGGRATPRKEPGDAEVTRRAIKSASESAKSEEKGEGRRTKRTPARKGRQATRSTAKAQPRGAAKRTARTATKKTATKAKRTTGRKTTSRASKQAAALPSGSPGRITEAGGAKRGARKTSTRSASKTTQRGARKTGGRTTAKTSRRATTARKSTTSSRGGDKSRRELYERAKTLDIPGRSHMSKEQLAEAIRKAG